MNLQEIHRPPSIWSSAWLFAKGLLNRWYFWVGPLLLDPFELYDRFLKPVLPEKWRFLDRFEAPPGLGISALAVLLIWAAVSTYHELHKDKVEREHELETELTAAKTDPARKLVFVKRQLRRFMSTMTSVKGANPTAEAIFECRANMAAFVSSALDDERATELCQPYEKLEWLKQKNAISNFASRTHSILEKMAKNITEADIAQDFDPDDWKNWDPDPTWLKA